MVTAMSKPPLDANMLAQFTGSERFYRHAFVRDVIYTEGVKYVADTVGAYWLIDEIAFAQKHAPKLRNEDFQNWELIVSNGGSAVLICEDGNRHRLYGKRIEWTDFPEPGIIFYFCNDTLLLPSEY
jgi:hypothetical protein